MDVKFTSQKTYISEAEYMYDMAKGTQLGSSQYKFDDDVYKYLMQQGDEDAIKQYVYSTANAKNMTSDTFSQRDYNYLSVADRANYFVNEFYGDKNSESYKQNKAYFNQQIENAIADETFKNLNAFQKTINSIGLIAGNALNAVYGTVEGLLDLGQTLGGAIEVATGMSTWDEIKARVAEDITKTQYMAESLQKAAHKYSYLDRSAVWKVANDTTSAIAAMAPMLIPGAGAVGTAAYFGAMAGNTASQAIQANPDINMAALFAYTAAVTGVEFATEKLSGFILGGAGSAIDRAAFGAGATKSVTKLGQFASKHWIAKVGLNFLSEGMEESISEFADAVLYNALVWQGRDDVERQKYSMTDILYAGLIGGLTGGLIEGVSIATAKAMTVDGKKLTKTQTRILQDQLYSASSLLEKSKVADLQAKYNLTEDQLKTQHAKEYNKALEADKKLFDDVTDAVVGLSKIYQMLGLDGFQKAVNLANETFATRRTLLQNYISKATGKSVTNRAVENKFKTMNNGASFEIADDLNVMETRLQNEMANKYGIDVYFGKIGAADGNNRQFNTVLDNKTMVIDRSSIEGLTPQQILDKVIKTGLVESLVKDSSIFGKSISKQLRAELSTLTQQEVDATENSDIAKSQIKAIAEAMLFDKLTVSRIFLTQNSTFSRVYKFLKGIKEDIENKRLFKTQKGKLRYNTVLKSMKMYRDVVNEKLGNDEDAEIIAERIVLNSDELTELLNKMRPNDVNAHYSLLASNWTLDTAKREEAMLALNAAIKGVRGVETLTFKPEYSRIFDADYYNDEFVQNVMSVNPERDFRYNLQEYFITKYGFTISQQDGCLLQVIDYNMTTGNKYTILNSKLDDDLTDLQINPDAMYDYKNLSQLFNKEFNKIFELAGTSLSDVKLEFVETRDNVSKDGDYIVTPTSKTIRIYKPVGLMTQSQIVRMRDSLFHEVTHALADIQGLSNGTSTSFVKSCLLNEKDDATLQKLAKILCTEEFYEENKTNRDVLLDAVSFGVYRITDGEYAAEAYIGSLTRAGEAEIQLKAGYTMNRSGFIMNAYDNTLTGYGRFKGITLTTPSVTVETPSTTTKGLREAPSVVEEQQRKTVEGLRPAEEIVQDTKESLTKFFNKLNIRGKGFKADFVEQIRNGKISQAEFYDAIYSGELGNDNAINYILSVIAKNNKYVKTREDLAWLLGNGLAMVNAYKLGHPDIKNTSEAISREEIENYANSEEGKPYYKKSLKIFSENLPDMKQGSLVKKLIKMDFSNSIADVSEIFKSMIGVSESDTISIESLGTEESPFDLEDEASNAEKIALENMKQAGFKVDDISDIMEYFDELGGEVIGSVKNALEAGDIKTVNSRKYKQQIVLMLGALDYRQYVQGVRDKTYTKQQAIDAIKEIIDENYPKSERTGLTGWERDIAPLEGQPKAQKAAIMDKLGRIWWKENIQPLIDAKTEVVPTTKVEEPTVKTTTPEEGPVKVETPTEPVEMREEITKRMKKAIATNEEITIGDVLVETTGNENLKTEPTVEEEVKTYDNTPMIVEETIKEEEQAKKEEEKEKEEEPKKGVVEDAKTIADQILNVVSNTIKRLSKMQLTKATQLEYDAVNVNMIADPIFEAVTEENFDEIRQLISGEPTALEVFDQAMTMLTGANANERYSKEFVERVQNLTRKTGTAGAQRTALQNVILKTLKTLKPVTNIVKQLRDAGYEINVSEVILTKYDERLKDKDKIIKQYEQEIANLKKELKDNKDNEIEQKAIVRELFEKNQALANLKSGDPLAILDWMINNVESFEGLNASQEKLNKIFKDFIDMATKAEEKDKELGFYLKNKKGEIIAFPKAKQWLYKVLKASRNFRMWAMTSSPVSWIRNATGNAGMSVLDSATNLIERKFVSLAEKHSMGFGGISFVSPDSVQFNTTKGGKELAAHISKTQGTYITSLTRGETKYGTDESKITASREMRQKEMEDANGFKKFFLKAQDLNDWGLNRGPLGDEHFVYGAICRNMSNLVASSKDYLLKGIKSEFKTLTKLKAKGKLSDGQKTRYKLCQKALQTKAVNDVFDAIHPSEMKQLMESCKVRAFEQYFKNPNKLSKWVSNLAEKSPITAEILSWVLPFPKVASNIMCMAARYSPLGVINAFANFSRAKAAQLDTTGKFDPNVFAQKGIRNLAEASVGTIGLIAGALFAALGWVDIDDDDYQGLSLNVSGLNMRIGLSDMAPSLTTFSTAAAFVYGWKTDKGAFKQALNTVYDNTLLGNIDNVFRYSTPEDYVSNLSISYFSQYIPAAIKAINKVTTNQAYIDKSGNYFGKLTKTLGSYVPGISSLMTKKIDPYTGKPLTRTGSSNWWFNMLTVASPLAVEWTKKSGLEAEAIRLGTETTGLSGSFKISSTADDYDIKLSSRDKEKYSKERADYLDYLYNKIASGEETVKILNNETNKYEEKTYDQLTDKEKARVLSKIYTQATDMVKISYWTNKGHSYYVTNEDDYNTYAEFFKNIEYKAKWSGSKFVE